MKTARMMLHLGVVALAGLSSPLSQVLGQGTGFTYQGRLNDGSNPANGSYDLLFSVYDASAGGLQQGNTVTNLATSVSNGLFTVSLDFGNQFPGANRWLEIGVRTNGGGAFTILAPRQQLTAAPYAVQAANASTANSATTAGTVAAGNITGTIGLAQLPAGLVTNNQGSVTLNGTFTGNGAGVTNILLANVSGLGLVGTFTWPGIYSAASTNWIGNTPQAFVAGDFNGDGSPDVATANSSSNSVTVLTNLGGGLVLSSTINCSGLPSVAAGDVNGDNKLDLVIGQAGSPLVAIWTNAGNAVFVAAGTTHCGTNVSAVAFGDFNGDNRPDLMVLTRGGPTATLVSLTNNGTGVFSAASLNAATDRSTFLAIADINGDNRLDVIGVTSGNPAAFLTAYTNDGLEHFTAVSTVSAGQTVRAMAAGEFSGDSRPDVVCVNNSGLSVVIFTNNGTGAFTASQTNSTSSASAVTVLDLNYDSKLDFVVTKGGGGVTGYTNDGTGRFSSAFTSSVGFLPSAVAAADFNSDGRQDLAVTDTLAPGSVGVLLQQPKFTLNSAALPSISADTITGGLTTNIPVLAPGGLTNILAFTNGILRAVQ